MYLIFCFILNLHSKIKKDKPEVFIKIHKGPPCENDIIILSVLKTLTLSCVSEHIGRCGLKNEKFLSKPQEI